MEENANEAKQIVNVSLSSSDDIRNAESNADAQSVDLKFASNMRRFSLCHFKYGCLVSDIELRMLLTLAVTRSTLRHILPNYHRLFPEISNNHSCITKT